MTIVSTLIQSSRESVSNLVANMKSGKFYADNSYQRRLVWTEKQKIRLIETIMMNYPVPEIYLWEQGADANTGEQLHSIVDGQQRLTTLQQFVAGEFVLKASALDPENRSESYSGLSWKKLGKEDKEKFWEYRFNTRMIPKSVKETEIRNIFMRLNETDKSLNPQEFRNAEFSGEFISAAEDIASLPFWRKRDVFKDKEIRRMIDIEFASGLLIFLRKGIVSDDAKSLNDIYDMYNDKYEMKKKDIAVIKDFLKFFDKALETPSIEFFKTPNNIYTLFCVYCSYREMGKKLDSHVKKLSEFAKLYTAHSSRANIQKYKEGASSRTRSKTSRDLRYYALEDFLNEKKK